MLVRFRKISELKLILDYHKPKVVGMHFVASPWKKNCTSFDKSWQTKQARYESIRV
jgi:hypothetical protein